MCPFDPPPPNKLEKDQKNKISPPPPIIFCSAQRSFLELKAHSVRHRLKKWHDVKVIHFNSLNRFWAQVGEEGEG